MVKTDCVSAADTRNLTLSMKRAPNISLCVENTIQSSHSRPCRSFATACSRSKSDRRRQQSRWTMAVMHNSHDDCSCKVPRLPGAVPPLSAISVVSRLWTLEKTCLIGQQRTHYMKCSDVSGCFRLRKRVVLVWVNDFSTETLVQSILLNETATMLFGILSIKYQSHHPMTFEHDQPWMTSD